MLHSRVAAFFETCSAFGHEVRQNGTECRLRVRIKRFLKCERVHICLPGVGPLSISSTSTRGGPELTLTRSARRPN
jgi:hypothetical protein